METGARAMWLYRVLSTLLFVYVIVTLGDENTSSLQLEEIIVLKLKTAAQLRENLGKVLSYLPIKDYEIYHSIKLFRKYLRDGGSSVNSLQVLPSIAYLPIREQINEILRSMENYMPRYLLPAIEVIRGAINGRRRALDVEEIFRPNYGPLKADLLYQIHAVDLPVVAEEIPFQSTSKVEERTELVDRALSMLSSGDIKPTGALIAQILDNIKVNGDDPEVRESVKHLVRVLDNGEKVLNNLTITDDPYETVKNAVVAIGGRQEDSLTWQSAQTLLPYLKKPEEYCTPNTKMEGFFVGELLNHSLLLSRQVDLRLSEAGKTLLAMIEREDINVIQAFEGFRSMEFVKPIDLLIASISHLRRYQTSQGGSSEALENVYAVLMKKYRSDDWTKGSLRNAGRTKTVLRGMISEESTPRIRRLVNDIVATIADGVAPGAWRKAIAFVSSSECHGPSCAALKILRALNDSRGIEDLSLKASVTELLTTWQEEMDEAVDNCVRSLRDESSSVEISSFGPEEPEALPNVTINATDLLQAVRGLVPGSASYSLLQEFLEDRKELERQLGEVIDLEAHPTRGRLLAWLLQKVAASENVEEGIGKLADDLVDLVSQEGYGAAGVEEPAQQLRIGS